MSSSHLKTRWTEEEIAVFNAHFPLFGNHFAQYQAVLDRTYSQIKSFYHNQLRKDPKAAPVQAKLPIKSTPSTVSAVSESCDVAQFESEFSFDFYALDEALCFE